MAGIREGFARVPRGRKGALFEPGIADAQKPTRRMTKRGSRRMTAMTSAQIPGA